MRVCDFSDRPADSTQHVNKKGHNRKQGNARPRVLVVEDDRDIRLGLCDRLEGYGYTCVAAEHGIGAVEKLLAFPFDVVITDFQMPEMDGLQLIEWLEKAFGPNHPPVLLLTGDMSDRVRERATRGGVYTILPKPFRFQDLLSSLTKVIRSNELNQKD